MKAVKLLFIFNVFFITFFSSYSALEAVPEFRPDDWNHRRPHFDRMFQHNLGHFHQSDVSPGLINLCVHLEHPEISYSEYSYVRERLIADLTDDEFLKMYNESEVVRSWQESEDRIESIFKENEYYSVETLIAGLSAKDFMKFHRYAAGHYLINQRLKNYHQKFKSGRLNKNDFDDCVILAYAKEIESTVNKNPTLKTLTPIDTSFSESVKNAFGRGNNPDRRFNLGHDAQSYIIDNFSCRDLDRVRSKFYTVEQRALQGRYIDNFNRIVKLSRNAPPKKQEFLKEAGNFGIIASECNHNGWVELGNKAVSVCENLLNATLGFAEGAWQNIPNIAHALLNPAQVLDGLEKAAVWCDELFTGLVISTQPSSQEFMDFVGMRHPKVMINEVLTAAQDAFGAASVRERARFVGEIAGSFFVPHLVANQGFRLIGTSLKTIRNLDIGNKAWRFVKAHEKLTLVTELGPLEVFAAETVNLMAETQKAAGSAARSVATYVESLSPQFIDSLISLQKMEKRVLNFMEMLGSVEEVEQVLLELKQLGEKFNNRIKCPAISDQLFKFDLDHLFGLDIVWKNDGVINKLSGFHFDPGGLIQKAGKVIFKNIKEGPLGLYSADVMLGGKLKPRASFFPQAWDRLKVMEKIEESLANVIYQSDRGNGLTLIRGVTEEGIVIETFVRDISEGSKKLAKVKTSYPNIKETIEYLNL